MKRIHFAGVFAALALLLAAGCGSFPYGNNYPNPNSPYPPQQSASSDMQGTVNYVDTRAQRIDLTVYAINGRSNNPYQTSVYYDSRTQVLYNGRNYTPANLEAGDQIDVTMVYNNGQSVADTITVTGDVRNQGNYPGGGYPSSTYPPNYPPPNNYPNANATDIQGTVSYVDTTAQRIDVTSAYANNLRNSQGGTSYSIFYGSNTPVYWNGQTYQPQDLERGDQIDARVYSNGNGQFQAQTITVTHNIRQ